MIDLALVLAALALVVGLAVGLALAAHVLSHRPRMPRHPARHARPPSAVTQGELDDAREERVSLQASREPPVAR